MNVDYEKEDADPEGLRWLGKVVFFALVVMLLAVLSGCEARTTDRSHRYELPQGLKDCKIYTLEGEGVSRTLYVVRCPNSSTNTTWSISSGKTTTYYSAAVVE